MTENMQYTYSLLNVVHHKKQILFDKSLIECGCIISITAILRHTNIPC